LDAGSAGAYTIYGRRFWHNGARCTWFVKRNLKLEGVVDDGEDGGWRELPVPRSAAHDLYAHARARRGVRNRLDHHGLESRNGDADGRRYAHIGKSAQRDALALLNCDTAALSRTRGDVLVAPTTVQ
jgi:hypothetical protein